MAWKRTSNPLRSHSDVVEVLRVLVDTAEQVHGQHHSSRPGPEVPKGLQHTADLNARERTSFLFVMQSCEAWNISS